MVELNKIEYAEYIKKLQTLEIFRSKKIFSYAFRRRLNMQRKRCVPELVRTGALSKTDAEILIKRLASIEQFIREQKAIEGER